MTVSESDVDRGKSSNLRGRGKARQVIFGGDVADPRGPVGGVSDDANKTTLDLSLSTNPSKGHEGRRKR